MKKIVLFLMLVCLLKMAVGQKLNLLSITSYTAINYAQNNNYNLKIIIDNNVVYLLDKLNLQIVDSSHQIKSYDLKELLDKNIRQKISPTYGYYYHIQEHHLFINNHYNIFVFELNKNTVAFKKHYQLASDIARNFYLNDSVLITYDIYNYHPEDSDMPSGYRTLNLKTDKQQAFPLPFKYLSLTHKTPNKFLDFSTKGYVLCDPFHYRLVFYNYNNEVVDSVIAPSNAFTVSNHLEEFEKLFPSEKLAKGPVDYFERMNISLAKTDRVWTVNFMDDRTIFVRITRNTQNKPNEKKLLFYDHIWRKITGEWQLIENKNISEIDLKSHSISKEDVWPVFIVGSKLHFSDGIIYYTFWGSGSNDFPQSADKFYGFSETDRTKLFLKVIKFDVN